MNKKEINERKAALIAEKMQDGTFWDNCRRMLKEPPLHRAIYKDLISLTPIGCIRVWDNKELESWLSPA